MNKLLLALIISTSFNATAKTIYIPDGEPVTSEEVINTTRLIEEKDNDILIGATSNFSVMSNFENNREVFKEVSNANFIAIKGKELKQPLEIIYKRITKTQKLKPMVVPDGYILREGEYYMDDEK